MFAKLNLPHPSEKLIRFILDLTNKDEYKIKYLMKSKDKSDMNPNMNCTINTYIRDSILSRLVLKEYQSFFDFPINVGIMIIENTKDENEPAMHVPHTDIMRRTALNYIIDCGGEHATIEFYNEYFDDEDILKLEGREYSIDNIVRIFQVQSYTKTWYMLNVRQCHSVSNITHKRIALSIGSSVEFDSIYNQYKHLVIC